MDETLGIEFEYPTSWGEIEVDLRPGDYTGNAYDYFFGEKTMAQSEPLLAGGRSKDFTEGRGGMPTDFFGFDNTPSDMRCSQVSAFYPICREVKPDVVWMIRFPDSEYFCFRVAMDAPKPTFNPVVRIEINLPQNPIIQGFVFEAPFLSEQLSDDLNNDLMSLLGLGPNSAGRKCDDSNRQEFEVHLQGFIELVKTSSLDSSTLENLDVLMNLAMSIKIRANNGE
jgi:hypothetical protein